MTAIHTATTRLAAAAADRRPCGPVRDLLPAGDISAAYAVQTALINARTSNGARVVGRKIGLTNPKVQAQLGVDQPDFGILLDDMACPQDNPVDHTRLLQPRIEAEIAFVLNRDLGEAGDISVDAVRAAVDYAVPALEIVDSRIADWDISIVDTVADNASSGLFVLGDTRTPLHRFDPVTVTMTMTRTGNIVSVGSGAECLGDPLAAVAWLATTARDYGMPLRAGDVSPFWCARAHGPGRTRRHLSRRADRPRTRARQLHPPNAGGAMSTPHTSRQDVGQLAPGTAKVAIAGSGSRADSMGTITQLSRWAETPA